MDEEQEMELEALVAIYMDEITVISETAPRKFIINLAPEGEIDEETSTMSVKMKVELPTEYPDIIPIVELESEKGVTDDECKELQEQLNELAEENLGTQMIFTLASRVQEWMIETQQQEEERKLVPSIEEQAETKRRQGTLLTRENFLEWKRKFDAEMAEKENVDIHSNQGKTGRELFEEDENLFADQELFVEDESLFMEEGADFD